MDDNTAAAVSTPIRDLRDEVWIRVYCDELRNNSTRGHTDERRDAIDAAVLADIAVAYMPIPAHRKPEGT